MRKLIVSMNLTLDGFMAGPDCELDWHFNSWNNEMAEVAAEQLSKADTILLGRVTYRAMARYWPLQAQNMSCAREDIAFIEMMNSHSKLVFTKTLEKPEWSNTRFTHNDITDEIVRLKKQSGKNMIVYGSGKLVASLMQLDLVDEYQLWLHPVLLGKGKPLFKDLNNKINIKLIHTKTFGSGVVMLFYECNHWPNTIR